MLREEIPMQGNIESWRPPSLGFIKINVDAGYVSSINVAAVAAVARCSLGQIRYCSTRFFRYVSLAIHAELLAIKIGVELALFKALRNVILESNSLFAIKQVSRG
ncbi:hypothetical protein PTKIN_Ptkin06aG0183700 [Pterospermum kingtungense]